RHRTCSLAPGPRTQLVQLRRQPRCRFRALAAPTAVDPRQVVRSAGRQDSPIRLEQVDAKTGEQVEQPERDPQLELDVRIAWVTPEHGLDPSEAIAQAVLVDEARL